MGRGEFIALVAMLFSTVAFSVDALLVAFPAIEQELNAGGTAHYVVTAFMAGLAIGTLFAGPISDAMGRKPTMYIGASLFIISGVVAWVTDDYRVLLFARFVQGLAASGPRVVSLAIVRDLYEGRQMAQIISFAMVLFTIVPTLAPALGAVLQDLFGWRSILLAFLFFVAVSTIWLWGRLPETLPVHKRRALRFDTLWQAVKEVLQHPVVRLSIAAQCVALAMIFGLLVQVQPIYDQVFDSAETFPYWSGGVALFSAASTSLANASLVVRFGMRRMVTLGMAGQVICAAIALFLFLQVPEWGFWIFLGWQFMLIWLSGLSVGNLNAIALEPMGHIAGLTASITGAISTVAAAIVASFVGLIFNGTPIPLLTTNCFLAICGLAIMLRMHMVESGDPSSQPAFASRRTP